MNIHDPVVRRELKELMLEVLSETNKEVLTSEEAMERYAIESPSTLWRYHRQGLRYIKGKPNKYFKRDLDSFFKSRII